MCNPPLHKDILRGYKAIALYYFGTEAEWRKICHLCTTGRFPHFREGAGKICARKTTIDCSLTGNRFDAGQAVDSRGYREILRAVCGQGHSQAH
jgi:hypothetical protein